MPEGAASAWDPRQYERFASERSQPFVDLVAAVPPMTARSIADLGCGTAELTASLRERWPDARIWGVDSSPEMLGRSGDRARDAALTLVEADLATWQPPGPLDLIVSNAALHWVKDHAALLRRLASLLAPGGVLAVQIPDNGGETAYRILNELIREAPWAERCATAPRPHVESAAWYHQQLHALGLAARVWATKYYHALSNAAAIVEWLRGTSLRPILAALGDSAAEAFSAQLTTRIERAYTAGSSGVLFPFRRLFFVGQRCGFPVS